MGIPKVAPFVILLQVMSAIIIETFPKTLEEPRKNMNGGGLADDSRADAVDSEPLGGIGGVRGEKMGHGK